MTRRTHALDAIAPHAFVEIAPTDMKKLRLCEGDWVRVSSRRGVVKLQVKISDKTSEGSIFIPFHFKEAAANLLTNDALDPYGKIPEFKFCAVKVEKSVPVTESVS